MKTRSIVAALAALAIGGCGQVAASAPPSDQTETSDASMRAPLLPVDGGPPIPNDECTNGDTARAGTIAGGSSLTTFLALRANGVRNPARTLRSPYVTGSFAPSAGDGALTAICGARGVYYADGSCGQIAFAACDEPTDAGVPRSCIYLQTNSHLNASERLTTPAGLFVDETGQCWKLRDASVLVGDGGTALGDLQSGSFEATAVAGPAEKVIRGEFVACRAIEDRSTCK